MHNILLVEDDAAIATVVSAALEEEGFHVVCCASIAERDAALNRSIFAVMLTDIMLTDGDGIETLPDVHAKYPDMPVIILSAQNTLDTAVRATDTGAFEYFPKPFDLDELVRAATQAARMSQGETVKSTGNESGREDGPEAGDEMPLVGRSPAMQGVYRMITRVLRNDLTVLILGESGTGKELVAEAIHQLGHRKTGPFVAVNAAAIPAELIESELFGHEKGAFTGAITQAIGKFEQANGGTLFLDEIGDMPIDAQTRLLRALQSGGIRRVGGRQEIAINVRIVAATNRALEPMIKAGTFREDLYYRLNVVPVQLPPLRDRTEDIDALASHFLKLAVKEGLPQRKIDSQAIDLLQTYNWPGNVREFRNTMYRLALLARDDVIDKQSVAEIISANAPVEMQGVDGGFAPALHAWLQAEKPARGAIYHAAQAAMEKPLFEWALSETKGNQIQASLILGINRNTLRKRVVDLGVNPEDFA